MERVVITGGAGFIGSHLARLLVHRGFSVSVIDDLSAGREENIADIMPRIEFTRGDIQDTALLKRLFRDARYVCHLAAIASVPESIARPLHAHRVNVGGTHMVFSVAASCGVRKVVFASSSAVYGNQKMVSLSESIMPFPESPYAAHKLLNEYHGDWFSRGGKMDVVGLRFFNVYGPSQRADSSYAAVIPIFITSMLADLPPTIYGDGSAVRDFVYVEDVAGACASAFSAPSGVYNIGSGKGISVNQLFQLIKGVLGGAHSPIYKEARPGDISYSVADTKKAREVLSFYPHTVFSEGIRQTADYLRGS